MLETILILLLSLVLFAYWFRYTVVLLLEGQEGVDPGPVMDQLCLSQAREALQRKGRASRAAMESKEPQSQSGAGRPFCAVPGESERDDLPLDRLHEMIQKDYRMLRYLLQHAAGLGLRPLEHYLLILDYRTANMWYLLTRGTSGRRAHRALQEMASVLQCIACKMGERAIRASET